MSFVAKRKAIFPCHVGLAKRKASIGGKLGRSMVWHRLSEPLEVKNWWGQSNESRPVPSQQLQGWPSREACTDDLWILIDACCKLGRSKVGSWSKHVYYGVMYVKLQCKVVWAHRADWFASPAGSEVQLDGEGLCSEKYCPMKMCASKRVLFVYRHRSQNWPPAKLVRFSENSTREG